MFRYFLSRFIQMIVVLIGASIILFLILYKLPGDPAKRMAGIKANEQTVENIRNKLGLDKPVYVQYFRYMTNLAQGDLGTSYRYDRSVSGMLADAFPATAMLALFAIVIEVILGIIAGVISALRRRKFLDVFITVSSTFLICIPVFWLGMILQYYFGIKLGWFPISGYEPFNLSYIVLPGIAVAAISTAVLIRLIRASMLEVGRSDYLTMARAKGLSEKEVVVKHQLRNALMPAVTFISIDLGALLTGAIATEIVFNYPGIGKLIHDAVSARDMPVIVSGVLILVLINIVFNFFADIAYGFINPRIRMSKNA